MRFGAALPTLVGLQGSRSAEVDADKPCPRGLEHANLGLLDRESSGS